MAKKIKLNYHSITFPDKCLCCGQSASRKLELEFQKGFDVIFLSIKRWKVLPVPLCKKCYYIRRLSCFSLAIVFALFVGLLFLLQSFIKHPDTGLYLLSALMIFFVMNLYFVRNYLDLTLDRIFLGVSFSGYSFDSEIAVLWFRNDNVADEVKRLSDNSIDNREDSEVI